MDLRVLIFMHVTQEKLFSLEFRWWFVPYA
jgi:hypothetical protein